MDETARALGYKGANPADLIDFAEELRKIYPETIPPTGFQGGIRTSISGFIEKVAELGAPGAKDQQKALRELIDALLRDKALQ